MLENYFLASVFPPEAEMLSDGAKGYGAFAISLIGLSGVFALVALYSVVSRGTVAQLQFLPEVGHPALHLSAAAAGSVVLLTTIGLYAGLAIGAHDQMLDKGKGMGMLVSLWPYPAWAAFSAFFSGVCLLGAAWRLQGEAGSVLLFS